MNSYKDLLLKVYNNKETLIKVLESEIEDKKRYIETIIDKLNNTNYTFDQLKNIVQGHVDVDSDYTPILLRVIYRVLDNISTNVFNKDPVASVVKCVYSSSYDDTQDIAAIKKVSRDLNETDIEIFDIIEKIEFINDLQSEYIDEMKDVDPWDKEYLNNLLNKLEEVK